MIEKAFKITEDNLEDLPNNCISADQLNDLTKTAYAGWLDYGAGVVVRDNFAKRKSLQFIPLHDCGKLCHHPISMMSQYLASEHGMSGQWIVLLVIGNDTPCLQGFAIKLKQSMDNLNFTIA